MKKVLEGELTSLAHSILKSKSDNVHELKEKAGLLYEKLCVLSFAEKHFGGKQPNIGKAAFKSAFEMDLTEMTSPTETQSTSEKETRPTETPVENEKVSTEKLNIQQEQTTPKETSVTKEETSTIQEASLENKATTHEAPKEQTTPEKTSITSEESSTTQEADSTEQKTIPPHEQLGLTEEDFGVHFDELPDFEPISVREKSVPKETEKEVPTQPEDTASTSENKTSDSAKNTRNTIAPTTSSKAKEQEKARPQRTMDLFSQDKKSLNDQLKTELKIGLNDRLAFTKKLFDGNVEAYNRVIAKMNDFSSFQEAKAYLMSEVKPNYPWQEHESIEQRFLEIIESKLG